MLSLFFFGVGLKNCVLGVINIIICFTLEGKSDIKIEGAEMLIKNKISEALEIQSKIS